MHIKEPMPLIRDYNQLIPQSLENIILKATSKNPLHRYQSISELSKDLSSCLNYDRKDEKPLINKEKIRIKNKDVKVNNINFFFPFFLKKWFLFILLFIILVILGITILFLII